MTWLEIVAAYWLLAIPLAVIVGRILKGRAL